MINLRASARDLNHDVDFVALSVSGPATGSSTIAVHARSATVTFPVHIDANAPLGSSVRLDVRARDTSVPFAERTTAIALMLCGAPQVTSVSPPAGPLISTQSVRIFGSGFIPSNTRFSIGPETLVSVRVVSSTIADAMRPLI